MIEGAQKKESFKVTSPKNICKDQSKTHGTISQHAYVA